MDVEAVKAEIRRRMEDYPIYRPPHEAQKAQWVRDAFNSVLIWIEAQQAAELKAAEGFTGTTLTSQELVDRYLGRADADPRTGVEYGDID